MWEEVSLLELLFVLVLSVLNSVTDAISAAHS